MARSRLRVAGRRLLIPLVLAVLAGGLVARFLLVGSDDGFDPVTSAARTAAGPQARVADVQERLRADPDQPQLLTRLGAGYLTLARQTADPAYYTKASQALERSLVLAPDDPQTMTAMGLLEAGRHNFEKALEWASRAVQAEPGDPDALGVVVDAQVELGHYEEAAATVQRMVDLRPDMASLARVSYVRELNGDTSGAIAAMAQAATAGGGTGPDVAAVESTLGNLHLGAGSLDAAGAAYRRALLSQPENVPGAVGLARVAAARGDLDGAIRRLEPAVARLPLPDSVALLGDCYAAAGRSTDAARQYELVRTIEALNRANGVVVDLELARFESAHAADPGADPAGAIELGQTALARRPTIYAHDVLSWALRQAGRPGEALPHAQAAIRLGTRDALLWYHLAAVEADLGITAEARGHLATAFTINRYLTVADAPAVRRLAAALGLRPPPGGSPARGRPAHAGMPG